MNKQLIPNNYELIKTNDLVNSKLNDLKFYGDQKKLVAMCHSNKTKKPIWHYRFQDINQMRLRIEQTIKQRIEHKKEVINKRERVKQPHTFKVGDFICCSWGYDQTNIDFYMITEIVSDRSVRLAKVKSKVYESEETYDLVVPTNEIIGKTQLKKVGRNTLNEYVKFSSFEYGFKWSGQPKHKTNSLYGH